MRNKKHETEKKELQLIIDGLEKEKKGLKEDVAKLELQKKMETEDIKHMVKIDRERKNIEIEKEKILLQAEQVNAIATVKDEYRDKTEKQLENQVKDMKSMYSEILTRLPKFTMDRKIVEKS